MKKIILISLLDYLAAGGEINNDDKVYRKADIAPVNPDEWSELFENSLFVGHLLSTFTTDQGTYLLENSTHSSFPMVPELLYVKVTVTIEHNSIIA